MGLKKVVTKSVVAGWNVPRWVGVKRISEDTKLVKNLFKAVFSPTRKLDTNAPAKETFEESMRRLGMTEARLEKRIQASSQIIFLCGILAIPVLGYAIYLLSMGMLLPAFVCFMLTFLLAAHSFREHFNRFQMRQRRLGCTFKEWLYDLLKSKAQRKTS